MRGIGAAGLIRGARSISGLAAMRHTGKTAAMSELLQVPYYVGIVVIGILPIMNPLSTVPLVIALTRTMPAEERKRQIRLSTVYAASILIAFLLAGQLIISGFGISLPGIRVAGGLIILALGFRMIFTGQDETGPTRETVETASRPGQPDIAFTPLAMPSLSGPGSIAAVLGYSSQIPPGRMVLGYLVITLGIAVTLFIAWLVLSSSFRIAQLLGKHGVMAMTKIMGFLLTCIAVQFIASGIHEFILAWRPQP
ncbi:MarC family NAAT transporter [Roseomonas gilardii subsp. gilardii]|uniref:MarC family NAAT transporter n=1 Tax=Roseomonas gilardii TaxID=257708 RepID=UPI001FFB0E3B|nr:MarC family NAAT transporter [Roseomonas gilardii]UPG71073.1 MarC family NAAT transporter [Roseomonas gilardii subsp. gilardii]